VSSYWVDLIDAQVRQIHARYRTRIIEAGSGPHLLLLHGTGGHAENYVRNIGRLSKHFHVVAPDFIWHGRSQTDGFDPEIVPSLVDHLIDIMDVLAIDAAAVEGQSMGGWVAMQLALQHPPRVKALILTTTQGYVPDAGSVEGYVEPDWAANIPNDLDMLREPTFDKVRNRMSRIVADPASLPDEAVEVRLAHYRNPALSAVQQQFVAEYLGGSICRQHTVTDAMARQITQPTLVYWGDKNRTPPSLGLRLSQQVQRGEFHCAADTGHWAQFDSAVEHDRVVLEFLHRSCS
jgi:2-hydroxy-6-oxonona-2,4-dienedioate hydrolase